MELDELQRRRAEIDDELRDVILKRMNGDPDPIPKALKSLYEKLAGEKGHPRDRLRYFVFVAPTMRRLTIELGRIGHASGTVNLNAVELDVWLARLEGFDPEVAMMIDLRYFAGLSIRETATALGVSAQIVIRDLRFAKAWLQARVRWAGGKRTE